MSVVNSGKWDDVVLTGLSGRLPEADSIQEFEQKLFGGVDMVTEDDRRWTPGLHGLPRRSGKLKNLSHFDATFFGVSAKQAHRMDFQQRLLLEVTHETLVDAGLNPAELHGSRTGVYVGSSNAEGLWGENADNINGYELIGFIRSMIANRISFCFHLSGPSMAVDTSCASALTALTLAVNAIREGHCEAAVVAGSALCLKPEVAVSLQCQNVLSPEGRCAAFDANASGYVRSEAVVAVLLQRRRDARRVYCTVRGARVNTDGNKAQGFTYPAGCMQLRLAQENFEDARLRPQDVAYVEAHGTGTKVGDPEEVKAISELYCKDRQSPLLLGSVKSNMGHTEPASGLCSIIKVALAMERGVIPGNLHFKRPNPDIAALNDGRIKVVDKNTKWEGGLVTVNSFGFGGSNAHVILESHDGARALPVEYSVPRLVLASGRTDEAVQKLLSLAIQHRRDAELHALLDAVHSRDIPRHPRRGYVVLDQREDITQILEMEDEPRPIWFLFSGMGSQWTGMGCSLLRLPAFSASIDRSAAALKSFGLDLKKMLTAPDTDFHCVINSFVSIAAVQVALVDVLRELGVRPDGIIGASFGETACAYADDTLTAEQAMQCAYWRGRCIMDAKLPPGAMATVGLSWEEIRRRCTGDIECAVNLIDHCVISGSATSIENCVKELSSEGLFARRTESCGVAFHSKYILGAVERLRTRLQQVIPEPKLRSTRWLSTSVRPDQMDSEFGKLSDAEYQVNNLVSPVRLAEQLRSLPARALVLELGPHALLQTTVLRTLPLAKRVPLVRRDAPDTLTHLLSAIGKIYAAGAQPQVSRLYPPVVWPVSRGTPSLASHVGWDHSTAWDVATSSDDRVGEHVFQVDVTTPTHEFLSGHDIDGRVLFPATGYLTLVWRTVAKVHHLKMEEASVVLENVQFRRATIVSAAAPLRFLVTMLRGTGEFEVCESGAVVATGTARLTRNPAAERLPVAAIDDQREPDDLPLEADDIYKELRLRGLLYRGVFRGIVNSDARGTRGLVKWDGNWITYLDALLQFVYISDDRRQLYLPTSLQRVVIDPTAMVASGTVPLLFDKSVNVVAAGGVELRGLRRSLAPRRAETRAGSVARFTEYKLIPLLTDTDRTAALAAALQLALENCSLKLKLVEPALHRPADDLLLPQAISALEAAAVPELRVVATLVAGGEAARYADVMSPLGIKVSDKSSLEPNCHVVLAAGVLSRGGTVMATLAAASAAFVLLQERAAVVDDPAARALLADASLVLVSRARVSSCEYLLLRRTVSIPATRVVIEVHNDDFSWVKPLKQAMKRAETEDMRVYIWSREEDSGVQGLGMCLRREAGSERLRVYYLPGAKDAFDPDTLAFKEQVQRDLVFNVFQDGVWGNFCHLPFDNTEAQVQAEHAYVNTLTRGDLSSLRWVASDAATRHAPHQLCRVHCAPLNFRDVMLATGKLPPDALPGDLAAQECILGLEFSGRSSDGTRVMGMVQAKGLATTVLPDVDFIWEVPQHWSLEEAATVPVVYSTAYYALTVRGRMRSGETVLVHAGAGGVGQAAIAIALHAGCNVFVTVGTPEKRAFLLERFPELTDANIGNSRDCSFEDLVLRRTRGRGVDLVLNSLAGDKLQASLRCLAEGGRFLEIGKLDLSADTALGMSVFLKNTAVQGIVLDALFGNSPDKAEVVRCVAEGIASGAVRPLPATLFADNQLEQAFRYMATGKHIGKVLVRVREECSDAAPAPARLVTALSRVYMHPNKSYVLVGGLGGFGLELANWLVARGARVLLLTSRSGIRSGYQAWCARRWRASGVRVLVWTADATSVGGARALLRAAAARAPIGGIFCLAAVTRDALLENLSPEAFRDVVTPKINMTRALDVASRELAPGLEHFVVFSSVASGRGSPGQSNYGLANSGTERLCEQRKRAGLPALAVQWGAIGDAGMLGTLDYDTEVIGTLPQPMASCLATLGALMSYRHGHPAVVSSAVLANRQKDKPVHDIVQAIANILGIREPTRAPQQASLLELGMDSLMSAEITQALERCYDVFLSPREVRALTFEKLQALLG